MRRNVAILIFDDVEVLDFAGPFEVFAVTDELRGYDTFNVFTFAENLGTVRARNGLKVVPHFSREACPPPHVLIVPGGVGTRPLLNKPALLEWLRLRAKHAEIVMSVCTGALVLAKAGLLDGRFAYVRNLGSPVSPWMAPLSGAANPLAGLDEGDRSAPAAADLNGDGVPDLVAGNQLGTLSVRYLPEPGIVLSLAAGVASLLASALRRRARRRPSASRQCSGEPSAD